MPRTCSICTHERREAIDRAIVDVEPYRSIAERFGVSIGAIARHKAGHLPSTLAKAREAEEVARADDLVGRLMELNRETWAVLREARRVGAAELALKAIARAEKQIELQAKLLGELQQEGTVNILVCPEWVTIRQTVVAALSTHPDARLAVLNALKELDDGLDA